MRGFLTPIQLGLQHREGSQTYQICQQRQIGLRRGQKARRHPSSSISFCLTTSLAASCRHHA